MEKRVTAASDMLTPEVYHHLMLVLDERLEMGLSPEEGVVVTTFLNDAFGVEVDKRNTLRLLSDSNDAPSQLVSNEPIAEVPKGEIISFASNPEQEQMDLFGGFESVGESPLELLVGEMPVASQGQLIEEKQPVEARISDPAPIQMVWGRKAVIDHIAEMLAKHDIMKEEQVQRAKGKNVPASVKPIITDLVNTFFLPLANTAVHMQHKAFLLTKNGLKSVFAQSFEVNLGGTPLHMTPDETKFLAAPDADQSSGNETESNQSLRTVSNRHAEMEVNLVPTEAVQEAPVQEGTFELDLDALGGPKERFKGNIKALTLLGELQKEKKEATDAEKQILSRYVGWGGLADAFDEKRLSWKNEYQELRSLVKKKIITEEQYSSMRRTTQYAHYTPQVVVEFVAKVLQRFGFHAGRILEPAVGTGNFFGFLPADVREASQLIGVEMDDVTAKVASYIYPSAIIQNKPYQDFRVENNYFDVAIGNPPFSDLRVEYQGNKHTLHNYFFVKSLHKLREGGILAFVTSSGSMNSKDASSRKEMAKLADFLGGVRLPNTTFQKTAGATVTSDILFFRKRYEGEEENHVAPFIDVIERTVESDPSAIVLDNEYFVAHPEMVLGKVIVDSLRKSKIDVCSNGSPLSELLQGVLELFPAGVYTAVKHEDASVELQIPSSSHPSFLDEGNYYFENGILMQVVSGGGVQVNVPEKHLERIKGMVQIRDSVNELLHLESSSRDEFRVMAKRQELNEVYDAYVSEYGFLNSQMNVTAFKKDFIGLSRICSLEKVNGEGQNQTVTKMDILEQRVINCTNPIRQAADAQEALIASLFTGGRIDLHFMSEITGFSQEKLLQDLGDSVYLSPEGEYRTSDDYLSGNVRVKYQEALQAAQSDSQFNRNVEALKAVIPADVAADEIAVQFGTPWIPAHYLSQFMNEFLKPINQKLTIRFISQLGQYFVEGGIDSDRNRAEFAVISDKHEGDTLTAVDLVTLALNSKEPTIRYTSGRDDNGNKIRSIDDEACSRARALTRELQDEFVAWLWSEEERHNLLVRKYNDEYNAVVLRHYNGRQIYEGRKIPGFNNNKYTLRSHQMDAIWRTVQGNSTLLGHAVGAGKTLEAIVSVMEMKRLGLVNKPIIAVPKSLLKQWEGEFLDAYPAAKLFVISNDDIPSATIRAADVFMPGYPIAKLKQSDKVKFEGDTKKYRFAEFDGEFLHVRTAQGKLLKKLVNQYAGAYREETREEFKERQQQRSAERAIALNRIAYGSYDCILISHPTFQKLPVSAEWERQFIERELDDLEYVIRMAKEEENNRVTIKNLESAKEKLEEKLKALREAEKEISIPFENLGIDMLIIDEAHYFKNLYFNTKLTGITGLPNTPSQRALDMFLKVTWIRHIRDGKGVVFLTGTPVANTMAELYTMMRYLLMERLEELQIGHFDSWAKLFAETESSIELDVSGAYKRRTRFKKFRNLPELLTLFHEFSDIKTKAMLNLPRPKELKTLQVVAELSPSQKEYMEEIVKRAEKIKNGSVDKSEDNWLKLTGDARKMSLDIRLLHPDDDYEGSKINMCIDNMFEIWENTTAGCLDKFGEPIENLTQLCFLDMGTPKAVTVKEDDQEEGAQQDSNEEEFLPFDIYSDIKRKLIEKGIPAEQIAFIHDAKNDKTKKKLFDKVKRGQVRILLGSTEKMGTGMNVQDRLIALHHLDCPWRPADVEQREGRIDRQGNRNDAVTVYTYATRGSFDQIMWDLLRLKATFIEQVMNGKSNIREIEDIGPMQLRFAEVSAVASGNTLIIDKMQVDEVVRDLENQKSSHNKAILSYKGRVFRLPELMEASKERLQHFETNFKQAKEHDFAEGELHIKLRNAEYTKKEDALSKLESIIAGTPKVLGHRERIGTFKEFPLYLSVHRGEFMNTETNLEYFLVLEGAGSQVFEAKVSGKPTARTLNKLGTVDEHFAKKIEDEKNRLQSLEDELKTKTRLIDTPFKYEEQLREARQKQRELDAELLKVNDDKHTSVEPEMQTA